MILISKTFSLYQLVNNCVKYQEQLAVWFYYLLEDYTQAALKPTQKYRITSFQKISFLPTV